MHGPEYGRSISLNYIDIEVPTDDHVSWVNDDKARFGSLTFDSKDENEREMNISLLDMKMIYRLPIVDTRSFLYFERATNQDKYEYMHGPEYDRSISLNYLDIEVPTDDHVSWVNDDKVRLRSLTFDSKDENEIKEITAESFKEVVKQANCDNATYPESLNSVDVSKGINPSNATSFQVGKQVKLSDHLKTFQDLNSQLQDSYERLQELENRKTVLLKEKAMIQAKKLQVEDRYGALTSGIVTLEKILEQGKKDK
ncbi:hypothetical protein ACH5RR_002993 [Cinchona calisaya]|uniref:Uncharacterized protein n=1 Tax=Cinchona calisaya TaxID=153742 RepID=A0ABD3ATI9_9GENT